jgi:hypothetical protein
MIKMRLLQVDVYDPVVVVLADPQHRRSLSSSSIRSLKRRDNVQNEQNPQNPSPFFPSFFFSLLHLLFRGNLLILSFSFFLRLLAIDDASEKLARAALHLQYYFPSCFGCCLGKFWLACLHHLSD